MNFADEVVIEDIARAMQHALSIEVLPKLAKGDRFACITHSTGGVVAAKMGRNSLADQCGRSAR